MSYLDELNESQRNAVLYNEGPSLVIAGAGSGKTRVLTYKIAYLLEQGYEPWSILALTFTNKAAREMKERIAKQVGGVARYLWMGTFHSIFSRILRTEAESIGFTPNFTIYDGSDSKSLIRTILKEMQLDEKVYKPGLVQSRISHAKNHLLLPDAYANDAECYQNDVQSKIPAVREVYLRYWNRCKQSDAMDFDDLLLYTYQLFHANPAVRRKYAERFQYVLVDEYQDTNVVQHSIVQQLTEVHQRICVVGDDAQSIYSFRGAKIENILRFTKLYQHAQLFKLEQNYRSTQIIVQAANSLIAKNSEQIKKHIFSENSEGEPIAVFQAYSDLEEGEIVVNKILELRRKHSYNYADFAILYRTNAQSRIFEEALRKRALPYKIYGGLSFYQRKEIKDVIAYFRLAVNAKDEEAFKRVVNYPARGIGNTTLQKLATAAVTHEVSFWEVLHEPLTYQLAVNKGTHAKLQGFHSLIEGFHQLVNQKDAYELGAQIVRESGIVHDVYSSKDPESQSRQENIESLLTAMNEFCVTRQEEGNDAVYLADFLSEVSLFSDQDNEKEEEGEKITLMTVHAAKGLEFKNVFVVGMEENLFPSQMALNSYKQLEEERRLCYVAITRAEEHCYLSFAKSRFKYGKMEFTNPSRFLKEIDVAYLDTPLQGTIATKVEVESARFREAHAQAQPSAGGQLRAQSDRAGSKAELIKPGMNERRLKKVSGTLVNTAGNGTTNGSAQAGVCAGERIEHERFGQGVVEKVEGTGDNCKLTVRFQHAGTKQLLLKFARFKKIE
ncbi:MAG: ATP-dependent helicase [Phocaeicola sp.]